MSKSPGRPRNPAVDSAIAYQALRLLAQRGFRALTIDGVAAAAGITKATLYRRYRNKSTLVTAALSTMARNAPQPRNTGSVRRDLTAFARDTIRMMTDLNVFPLLAALIVRAAEDPKPLALLRRFIILPRRHAIIAILIQAQHRSELSRTLDPGLAADSIIGSVFTRYNAGLPLDERWQNRAIAQLLRTWRP